MSTLSWGQPVISQQTGPIEIQEPITTQEAEYYWDWGSTPQTIAIGTAPSIILEAVSEPRLISYRAEGSSSVKIKLWLNSPTSGVHEYDSFGGHNISNMELSSGLKASCVSGTAQIIVNTAQKVVII